MAAFVGILGSGSREHALAWRMKQEQPDAVLSFYPGNDFLSNLGLCFDTFDDLVKYGESVGPERVLICGSEAYAGFGDDLEGWSFWGPSAEAAQLEHSKMFAKEWMQSYGIPTAQPIGVVRSKEELLTLCDEHSFPFVLKYDGLAAGKGVSIIHSRPEADAFYDQVDKNLGPDFTGAFLVETVLSGVERSLFLQLNDDGDILPVAFSMDFKGKVAGGINTGGMGAFTPASIPKQSQAVWDSFLNDVLIPRLKIGLKEAGLWYRGILYVGLMFTDRGPQVLEFNVRFGDPEAQTILPALKNKLWDVVRHDESMAIDSTQTYGAIVCATTDYGEADTKEHGLIPLPWFSECPYLCFWGNLFKREDNRYQIKKGRVATLVYHFPSDAANEVIEAVEKELLSWVDANGWPHLHRRDDLGNIYLDERD